MPEGDTIHNAAKRIRGALLGKEIVSIETPQRRHERDRWPERLTGHGVRSVDAHGKHLFVRFDNDLTLHSHLRMTGWWGVYEQGGRWGRSPRRAWLVIRTPEHEVVEFDGPVLELMTDSRTRFDQIITGLGPDVLAEELDEKGFLRRLRDDDQTRPIGDALLEQRNLAGLGTIWRSEGCFLAGINPWRMTGDVSDEEALAIVHAVRPRMRASADGNGVPKTAIYNRAGRPCPRCDDGTLIRQRGQGENNRRTFWCPGCQS